MCAEIREAGGRIWVVDLECGTEEPWRQDRVGACMSADEHNEGHHPMAALSLDLEHDVEARETSAV